MGKKRFRFVYTWRKDEVYGQPHLVVISFNPENRDEQIQKLDEALNAYKCVCEEKLHEFKEEIREKTFQSYWNNVEKVKGFLKALNRKLYPLLDFRIESFRFELQWAIKRNDEAFQKHVEHFGRYVLFTNRLELKPKEVLELFHNKHRIERDFQILKANSYTNRYVVLGPMLHLKDERIKTHVYLCVLALQLYQVVAYRLRKHSVELTVQQAVEELKDITRYYTRIAGLNEEIVHVNPLSETQKSILKALEIEF